MSLKRIDNGMLEQIERWLSDRSRGQYGHRLTWQKLATYSGFSRQSLSFNTRISKAFRVAKVAIKRGYASAHGETALSPEASARLEKLSGRISELERQAENWISLWERWRYNARQQGWDPRLLDQEIPKPLHRRRPRH
ncbi:hypothetical protein [Paraburkholderia sp.]|uniref:hypothetical protein n=1 Tax=Paraburkholderia sp. TaxID=1926495 RepID=UPI002D41C568|nr:hypothetical protein [Paraburkholderia sp.]HZZ02661.1 hypothetical protein [Paraburkholderia sp.]